MQFQRALTVLSTALLLGLQAQARPAIPDGTSATSVLTETAAGRQKLQNVSFTYVRPLQLRDFKLTGGVLTQTGDVQTTDPKGGTLIFELPAGLNRSSLKVQVQLSLQAGAAEAWIANPSGLVARPLGRAAGAGSSLQAEAAFDLGDNPLRVVVQLKPDTRLHWNSGAIYRRVG